MKRFTIWRCTDLNVARPMFPEWLIRGTYPGEDEAAALNAFAVDEGFPDAAAMYAARNWTAANFQLKEVP